MYITFLEVQQLERSGAVKADNESGTHNEIRRAANERISGFIPLRQLLSPDGITKRAPFLLSILVLAAGIISFSPTIRFIFSASSPEKLVYEDNLDDRGAKLSANAQISGDAVFTQYGLAVRPGGSFQVSWHGSKKPGELPFVRVWMFGPPATKNEIIFSSGNSQERISLDTPVMSRVVGPSALNPEFSDYKVELKASLDVRRSQDPLLVLDRVEVGTRVFPRGQVQPLFWTIFPSSLLPVFVWLLLTACFSWEERRALVAAGLAALAAAVSGLTNTESFYGTGLLFCIPAIGVFIWQHVQRARNRQTAACIPDWIALAAVLCIVFGNRWQWLCAIQESPLQPDAVTYQASAANMSWPYDTGRREPFHINLLWLFSSITAWGPFNVRLLTVIVSVAEGMILWLLGREFLHRAMLPVLLLLYAANPLLALNAPMGLREEELPTGAMLFLLGLLGARKERHGARYHALAVAGAVVCMLTRLNSLSLVVPMYAVWAWACRWPLRRIVAAGAILAGFAAPHLIYSKVKFGDWLSSNNQYGTWWRNAEFAGRPGFVTREEFQKNGYAGEPVSLSHYLFKMHRPVDITTATLYGLWRNSFGDTTRNELLKLDWRVRVDDFLSPVPVMGSPRWFEWTLFAAFLVGLFRLAKISYGWLLLGSILLLQLPIAFVSGWLLSGGAGRLAINFVPLMLIAAAAGLQFMFELAARGLSPGHDSEAAVQPARISNAQARTSRGGRKHARKRISM